jgi:alkylmercury lyase
MKTTTTIDRLAESLRSELLERTETEQRISLATVLLLADGAPPAVATIAADVGLPEAEVDRTLDQMIGVYRDESGRVIGHFGLSVVELGEHRIHLDGRTLSTWCAWDTLLMPRMLGRPVEVTTRAPNGGPPITLTATIEGPRDVSPPETVMSLLAPKAELRYDVIKSFCHYIHFFPSVEAADLWTAGHPSTVVVSLDDAHELGGVLLQQAFGDPVPARQAG